MKWSCDNRLLMGLATLEMLRNYIRFLANPESIQAATTELAMSRG
jgi:hypothetical protein